MSFSDENERLDYEADIASSEASHDIGEERDRGGTPENRGERRANERDRDRERIVFLLLRRFF